MSRRHFGRLAGGVLLVGVGFVGGCEKTPPPSTDPEKAPWLFPEKQIENLKNTDKVVRSLAAHHLGNMGAKAEAAIPELERLAKEDPDPKVRENAAAALEKIRKATGK
jgi:hypothetical protein